VARSKVTYVDEGDAPDCDAYFVRQRFVVHGEHLSAALGLLCGQELLGGPAGPNGATPSIRAMPVAAGRLRAIVVGTDEPCTKREIDALEGHPPGAEFSQVGELPDWRPGQVVLEAET